jgi:hypothetical protein
LSYRKASTTRDRKYSGGGMASFRATNSSTFFMATSILIFDKSTVDSFLVRLLSITVLVGLANLYILLFDVGGFEAAGYFVDNSGGFIFVSYYWSTVVFSIFYGSIL